MSNVTSKLVLLVPLVHGTKGTNGTNEHRYILEKGSKKFVCRSCTKKRFVKYIDAETNEYLPEQFGRCDRESKCAYSLDPYKSGYAKMIWEQEHGNQTNWKPQRPVILKKPTIEPVFIPVEVFNQTRAGYEKNVFIQNLLSRVAFPFEVQDIEEVISLYHLGTVQNGYRAGAITFPFIDKNKNVRTIQVKQFDKNNHTSGTDFLHSIIEKYHIKKNKPIPKWLKYYSRNDLKVSCLFGEHLLNKYPSNPIALVEAPKTAIYGTLYFGDPEETKNFIWMAVYNLSSLNFNKCKVLQGRDVYLFPDLSKDGKTFQLWSNKAKVIQSRLPGAYFTVSDLLEQIAPAEDKEQGNDLADYLIKQDWRQFRKQSKHEQPLPLVEVFELDEIELLTKKLSENWELKITELETFFSGTKLPSQPIKVNHCSTVTNVSLFIESHFAYVKANNGNRTYLPYLDRLQELKQVLIINSK